MYVYIYMYYPCSCSEAIGWNASARIAATTYGLGMRLCQGFKAEVCRLMGKSEKRRLRVQPVLLE